MEWEFSSRNFSMKQYPDFLKSDLKLDKLLIDISKIAVLGFLVKTHLNLRKIIIIFLKK